MPSRRNGESSRRWYRRICLASSADSSDSSESETYEPPPPVNIGGDHPLPVPATYDGQLHPPPPPPPFILDELPPAVNIGGDHPLPLPATYDWQLHPPPPPPPPFVLDELPQRVRRIHVHVTEIARVEDDHREVIRNMEITEAITRERTICPICKEVFKLGETAGKLPCGHFFCSECIHGWNNFNQNNTCPVCRRRLPAVPPPPPGNSEYFFPPGPFYTESTIVADETESSPSPSTNNSEAGYDTALDELDTSHAHPQDSLASSTPTTAFPYSATVSTSS